jgi:hypothetical protein
MIGAALMLLASQLDPAPPPPTPPLSAPLAVAPLQFAPPLGQPMTYRVTSRRLGRDGAMMTYALVYALQWDRAGRGLQLTATLRRIETDARPELARRLTGLLRPLVDQPMTYLVASDGNSIDLVDPDAQWQRVLDSVQDMGAKAERDEAKQLAALLAALSPADRDKMVTADVRALVAPANMAIPASNSAADVAVAQADGRRTVTRVERSVVGAGAPDAREQVEIATVWTIDTATGLVLSEERKTLAGAEARLVEERIRGLTRGDPG